MGHLENVFGSCKIGYYCSLHFTAVTKVRAMLVCQYKKVLH